MTFTILTGLAIGCSVISFSAMFVVIKLYTEYFKDVSARRRSDNLERTPKAHNSGYVAATRAVVLSWVKNHKVPVSADNIEVLVGRLNASKAKHCA